MDYRVELKPGAKRQLARLPRFAQISFGTLVERLRSEPRFRGVRPVRSMPGALRARLGDFRVVFEIDDAARRVSVVRIAPRDKAYRD